MNVTPDGSAPVSLNVGAGDPVAVTVNVPAVPTVNVVLFALRDCGSLTYRQREAYSVASLPTPLCAVNVTG